MRINEQEYEAGIDTGSGRDVPVEEHYLRPTAEYPMGSYKQVVGGVVMVATGYFAIKHPGKPSLYFHEGPPFVVLDTSDWSLPWKKETEK